MKPLARRMLWTLCLAILVIAAGVAAAVTWWPRAPRGTLPDSVPASWDAFRTSPGHRVHVDKGGVECRDCHDVEHEGFKNPGTAMCRKCHAKETTLGHHGGTAELATDCTTCHVFAPDKQPEACIDCHRDTHGKSQAVTTHATADCMKCHRLHESPSTVTTACAECHEERAPAHAAAADATCSSCHAQPAGPHPAGHDKCSGCHQPHDFKAGGESACMRCHGEKTTLAAAQVPAHAVCTSCHTPHDPASAASSCAGCHAGVHVEHGKAPAASACVTCHAPHRDDPKQIATSCTSCHGKVAAFDTGAHAGGITCERCHQPHEFSRLDRRAICARCHERQVQLVSTNAGHALCDSCHGAAPQHTPTKAPACGSCHQKELATITPGHETCQRCHDPHAGQPTPTCATCHATESAGPHGSIKGGCQDCHRAHGPAGLASPPACTTCHTQSNLPALHAASGHTNCASCHATPHAPPKADRATCTGSCHADKRDHQPGAAACTGCHVFRR